MTGPLRMQGAGQYAADRLIAEIADATRLAVGPDLDTLLRNAGEAGERLVQLESERHLQVDQIERLRGTVADLTEARRGRGRPGARRPERRLRPLSRGDTLAAENAFEREFEARAHGVQEERRAMAEAARNVANLAMLRDVTKAAAFYRKALDAQPDHAETVRCWVRRWWRWAISLLPGKPMPSR